MDIRYWGAVLAAVCLAMPATAQCPPGVDCSQCFDVCVGNRCYKVCPALNPAAWQEYQRLDYQRTCLRRTQFGFENREILIALARLEGQMGQVLALLQFRQFAPSIPYGGCPFPSPMPLPYSPFGWAEQQPQTPPSPFVGAPPQAAPQQFAPPAAQPGQTYGTPPRFAGPQAPPPGWQGSSAPPWAAPQANGRPPGVITYTAPR